MSGKHEFAENGASLLPARNERAAAVPGLGEGANANDAEEWSIARLLHEAALAFRRAFQRRARASGFTRSQYWVLMRLSYSEGIRQIALAQGLDLPPISVARLIDRLEEAGLVERRVDPTDRRARTLHLTPAARPQIARMSAIAAEVRNAAVSDLDEAERRQLTRLLRRVHGRLAELDAASPVEPDFDDEERGLAE